MTGLARYWSIGAVFVAMTALQATVAVFSIQTLSTVRAYVTGESLYSKGEKDAQIHLLHYASDYQEADYQRFVSSLASPLGDRAAREALQQPVPDIAAAKQAFLAGGSYPDDIDGLVRVFLWFQHVSFMADPIATWTKGDQAIQEMQDLVARARERILVGDSDAPAVEELRRKMPELNERLTRLTSEFSFQLGEASRTIQTLLLGLNLSIAFLLTVSGLMFLRRSARLHASAALRMERLIDAVTDGIVTVDNERKIVLFNRAAEKMFKADACEALGTDLDRFVTSSDQNGLSLAATSGPLREMEGTRKGGARFPAEGSISILKTRRGVLTTVVLRDVTARRTADFERQANESLEASNKAKTEFLSRMSHELRTPLNAVIGFSTLLRTDASKPLPLEQLQRVEHIERAGAHLLALVNDVLDLTLIESGEMAVAADAVRLIEVVDEAVALVSPLAADTGIEVIVAGTASSATSDVRALSRRSKDVWIKADAVRLRQVLVNLLSNAVKYNKPKGRVTLTWQLSNASCLIKIDDTGRGIPSERLKELFEPFNRLGAESTAVEGTGIGLVLSRQLTEMMGGTLSVSSESMQGTRATVSLRLAEAPKVVTAARFINRSSRRSGGALKVLYAEDNEVNVELVRQISRLREDVLLRVATSGASALAMARLDAPDLLLVDMNLGDMTGIQLAKELRANCLTQDIPLVALSADALPEQISAAMRSGFESYLTKPIVFEELLAMLDMHSRKTFV